MPLDPQAKALFDFIGLTTLPGVETMSAQAARERSKMLFELRKQVAVEPVHQVRDLKTDDGIPVRIYSPEIARPAPALVYFHGGGWVLGDLESHDQVCRALANKVPCAVVSVDYRLAPEAKFPAAVEDSYQATEWVAANAGELGIDSSCIAVGGDSAGGNLAAVVCHLARDRKGPTLAYQLLVYPATDMRMNYPSIEENADGPLLTKPSMEWFIGHYLRSEQDKTDPLASPLLAADLSGLPPAFVITAECDPIRDEGEAYGKSLERAGVAVEVKRYTGMPHGFFSFAGALDGGKQAMEDAAIRLRRAFSASSWAESAQAPDSERFPASRFTTG